MTNDEDSIEKLYEKIYILSETKKFKYIFPEFTIDYEKQKGGLYE